MLWEYNCDMILDECLKFYDLRNNKRYIFLLTLIINSSFLHSIYTKSVYAICFYNFHVNHIREHQQKTFFTFSGFEVGEFE